MFWNVFLLLQLIYMKNKTGGYYSVLVLNQATLKTLNKKNSAMLQSAHI